jgi:outer membrane lipoprotein-sorting protein
VNRRIRLLPAVLCLVTISCAPRIVSLPSGGGTDFPGYAPALEQATKTCASVKTLVAVMSISGRAYRQRLRAKIDAGFEAPSRVRLELPAPGKPFFTYVVDGKTATLVLPRDGRVLRDAPPVDTLEALTGVAIGPDDLRTIVAGCGLTAGDVAHARGFDGGWVALYSDRATTWLQQVAGQWQLAVSTRESTNGAGGPLEVRYSEFVAGRPTTIRLRMLADPTRGGEPAANTDLTIRLSQLEINEPIDPAAFSVEVPPTATPITLEDLRKAGPLGG